MTYLYLCTKAALRPVLAVPKVTIAKYDGACSFENDIRLPWQLSYVLAVTKAGTPQSLSKHYLRLCVGLATRTTRSSTRVS